MLTNLGLTPITRLGRLTLLKISMSSSRARKWEFWDLGGSRDELYSEIVLGIVTSVHRCR